MVQDDTERKKIIHHRVITIQHIQRLPWDPVACNRALQRARTNGRSARHGAGRSPSNPGGSIGSTCPAGSASALASPLPLAAAAAAIGLPLVPGILKRREVDAKMKAPRQKLPSLLPLEKTIQRQLMPGRLLHDESATISNRIIEELLTLKRVSTNFDDAK